MGRWMDELKANGCLYDDFNNFRRKEKNIEEAKPWHIVAVQKPSPESLMSNSEYVNWLFCYDCGCICGNVAGHSDTPEKEYKYLYNPKTMKVELI